MGGTQTTETIYTYTKGWSSSPEPSANFRYPVGHENPPKTLKYQSNKATEATIGVYRFSPRAALMPSTSQLSLNPENTTLSEGAVITNTNHIFIQKSEGGTIDNPQIGDLRVSYHVVRPGFEGTLFGTLNGDRIESYIDEDENSLHRLFDGTREDAIAELHSEYTTLLWILRVVGFFFMWVGLMALFAPISAILNIVPIFGSISRAIISLLTLIVAIIMTLVTIVVSMIFHSFLAIIIALGITLGLIITFFVMWRNKRNLDNATANTALTGTAVATSVMDRVVAGSVLNTVSAMPVQTTPPPVDPLESYVREARAAGMSDDQIRQELVASGWAEVDINRSLG